MANPAGRVALDRALDALERALGGAVHGVTAGVTDPLDRSRSLLDRAKDLAPYWSPAINDALRRVGDQLFEYADKTSGFVAKKAESMATEAYRMVAGPALILVLLWLLASQR